jgi:hypothetical protein
VYLVSAVLIRPPPFWALIERSRWSTVIMGIAALVGRGHGVAHAGHLDHAAL